MKKRIGIVGGGQLGRMLTDAAKKLGFYVTVLDPTPNSPAGQVADAQIVKSFKDPEGIKELANLSDFLTFEIESANAEALNELLADGHEINPSPKTLGIIKDKFNQKNFLTENKIPVADFMAIENKNDIQEAIRKFGLPLLLKSRLDAYDGRGNFLLKTEDDIEKGFQKLGEKNLYAEKFVSFVKELAVVVARGKNGEIAVYPPVETIHKNNICHIVIAPAPIPAPVLKRAEELARSIMDHLEGVGVFCIEMFLTDKDEVIINEIAPRVHNSGHHTIESSATSQFEQHIRAITGLPLGPTDMTSPHAVMINILGERAAPADPSGLEEVKKIPQAAVHIYGKLETKPERKMGHITVVGDDAEDILKKAKTARSLINI